MVLSGKRCAAMRSDVGQSVRDQIDFLWAKSALTQALLRLIIDDELRQQMGDAARERALVLFSSDKIAQELLTLYEKLSGGAVRQADVRGKVQEKAV